MEFTQLKQQLDKARDENLRLIRDYLEALKPNELDKEKDQPTLTEALAALNYLGVYLDDIHVAKHQLFYQPGMNPLADEARKLGDKVHQLKTEYQKKKALLEPKPTPIAPLKKKQPIQGWKNYHVDDEPWPDTLEKLKEERFVMGSIAQKLGPSYQKLLDHFDKLDKLGDKIFDGDPWGPRPSKRVTRQLNEVSSAIKATAKLLFTNEMTLDEYVKKAESCYKYSSPKLQVLGILMMTLALAAVITGVLCPPALIATVGICGSGFFAYGSTPRALAKHMTNIADDFVALKQRA